MVEPGRSSSRLENQFVLQTDAGVFVECSMIKVEILSVRDPQLANEDGSAIKCWVKTNTLVQEAPFLATSYDVEAHGREIYKRCLAGEFGEIAPVEPGVIPLGVQQLEIPQKFQRLERFLMEVNLENSRKSFRSVTIVWGALLDNLLDEMLEQEVLRESAVALAIGKPLRTFNARIKKAQEFGLIDQEEADKCQYVRRIRNVAAHRWEMSLTTEDVLSNLKALHEKDHANVLIFHEDLEFLIRHVYSGTCAMLAMTFFQRLS